MTDLEKEILEAHKHDIDKYKKSDEKVVLTQDPKLIEESKRQLIVLCKDFKGFLVGLYRSPKVQKIIFVILISAVIAHDFHIYSVLPEYKPQVIQGITDWQGWEQKSKEPDRVVFSNRFLILADDHTHEEVKVENLKAGTILTSISGAYDQAFDYYRKI